MKNWLSIQRHNSQFSESLLLKQKEKFEVESITKFENRPNLYFKSVTVGIVPAVTPDVFLSKLIAYYTVFQEVCASFVMPAGTTASTAGNSRT